MQTKSKTSLQNHTQKLQITHNLRVITSPAQHKTPKQHLASVVQVILLHKLDLQ